MANDEHTIRGIPDKSPEGRTEAGASNPGITTNVERPVAPQGSGGQSGDNKPTSQGK
jgi:hypothetical protein